MKEPQLEYEMPWESVGKKLGWLDKPHSEMRGRPVFLGTKEGSVLTSNQKKKKRKEVITATAQEGSDGKIMLIHRGGGEFQAQKVTEFQS